MQRAADRGRHLIGAQAPIRGRRPLVPPLQSSAMVRGQDRRGLQPVGMTPSLIREHLLHTRILRVRGVITPNSRADPPHLDTDAQSNICCIGSLSICDSIARTAAFAFADGGRIQRRLARTADPKLSQLTVRISPSTCSTKSWNISRASCPRIAVAL